MMRARSCPTCRSIGVPLNDCTDPWHKPTDGDQPYVPYALRVEERMAESVAPQLTAVLDQQVGGDHYRKYNIQPIQYILENNIPWAEGTAIKYITRWRDKGGLEDLRKAIHVIEVLIEHELAAGDLDD